MGLDSIVNIAIVLASAGLSKPGFGTIMCAANLPAAAVTAWGPELSRTYTSADAMLAASEGFTVNDRAYKMVAKVFSQEPKPRSVKVGRMATNHTQTIRLIPTNTTIGYIYFGKVQGTSWTATVATATVAAACDVIVAAITALGITGLTVTDDTTHVTLTATAGLTLDFTEMSTYLNVLDVTPNPGTNGTATDLAAIAAADNDWYMLVLDSSSSAINSAAAAWCETTRKVFVGHTADYDVLTSATNDIASSLRALDYFRTSIWYNQDISANIAPAIAASRATAQPGSDTWALKGLSGVRPSDHLTETQIGRLVAKNCNYYQSVGTDAITFLGIMAGGEYIDVVRFLDWFRATTQIKIYNALRAAEKVANTAAGYATIQGALEVSLKLGVKAGGFKENSTSSAMPDPDDTDSFDVPTRTLSSVTFSAKLANAVHAVNVTGRVTN